MKGREVLTPLLSTHHLRVCLWSCSLFLLRDQRNNLTLYTKTFPLREGVRGCELPMSFISALIFESVLEPILLGGFSPSLREGVRGWGISISSREKVCVKRGLLNVVK
jgi:hypothetical protein